MANLKNIKDYLGLGEEFKTHAEKITDEGIQAHLESEKESGEIKAFTAKPAVVTGESHDKKLDHFQYTKNPNDLDYWEFGENVRPDEVPKVVRDKYPDMRFFWRSKSRIDHLGMDYKGWQKFSDPSLGFTEGVRRGNDLILFAMPEERAKAYERYVSNESTARVRQLQEQQLEMDERVHSAGLTPYEAKGEGTGGIAIGPRPAYGKRPAGQHRGLSAEEVQERIAHRREEQGKNRTTFDMGRKG